MKRNGMSRCEQGPQRELLDDVCLDHGLCWNRKWNLNYVCLFNAGYVKPATGGRGFYGIADGTSPK